MLIWFQTMPLNENIESSHGKSQAGFEIAPGSVSPVFEVANRREHGKHRFNNHADIPGFGLADFQVLWITLFGIEAMVGQHNHLLLKCPDQGMKGSVVDVCGGTIPTAHQPFLVQQTTNLAAHNPTTVRVAFFPDLLVTATCPARMK